MELIKLTLIGFVLGIATIIPGLSTATMAVIFNVYHRLIEVIVPNIKKIIGVWSFWLPLIIGGLLGVVFASKVFTELFYHYEIPTYWFFIGVITGSLPVIYSSVCKSSSTQTKFKLPSISAAICIIITLTLMVLMAMFGSKEETSVYTDLTLPLFGLLFVAGAFGAIAMIVPGISGAFVLILIGFYRTVLLAVTDFNIPLLVPVVLGAGIGLLAGAAFVRFMLAKAPGETYGAVLGLVAGSVIVLYPGGFGEGIGIAVSVLCLSVGLLISFIMGRQKKQVL